MFPAERSYSFIPSIIDSRFAAGDSSGIPEAGLSSVFNRLSTWSLDGRFSSAASATWTIRGSAPLAATVQLAAASDIIPV